MGSKTEKPTQKRLRDAAQKGQSFKSRDLTVACLMLCGVLYLTSFASLAQLMDILRQVSSGGFKQNLLSYAESVFWIGIKLFIPILMLCVSASALPVLLQSGFKLATRALKLNLGAINPISGFKKIFSLRTFKDMFKVLLYLSCFIVAASILWHKDKKRIFAQLNGDLPTMIIVWSQLLRDLVLNCLGCIVIVLILDALAEYFLFMKDMKMDKEEVKREYKEQEGNQEVKSRRREIHMEILSEQQKSDIKNSRMLIANPTHIAIGIYLNPDLAPIPFISLRVTNQLALAARAFAEKNHIPVITDIRLARRLCSTHNCYDFVSLEELDSVLQLLLWLEQVENVHQTERGIMQESIAENEPEETPEDPDLPGTPSA